MWSQKQESHGIACLELPLSVKVLVVCSVKQITLSRQVVEEHYESSNKMRVVNTQAAMMLLQWLPDIQSHELQVWLAEQLNSLCTQGHRSRMSCCSAGMITHIITVLGRQKQIDHKAVGECTANLPVALVLICRHTLHPFKRAIQYWPCSSGVEVAIVMGSNGGFFLACNDFGRMFKHLFSTCAFFLLKRRLALAHTNPLSMPRFVHSGSASLDDCG